MVAWQGSRENRMLVCTYNKTFVCFLQDYFYNTVKFRMNFYNNWRYVCQNSASRWSIPQAFPARQTRSGKDRQESKGKFKLQQKRQSTVPARGKMLALPILWSGGCGTHVAAVCAGFVHATKGQGVGAAMGKKEYTI